MLFFEKTCSTARANFQLKMQQEQSTLQIYFGAQHWSRSMAESSISVAMYWETAR